VYSRTLASLSGVKQLLQYTGSSQASGFPECENQSEKMAGMRHFSGWYELVVVWGCAAGSRASEALLHFTFLHSVTAALLLSIFSVFQKKIS